MQTDRIESTTTTAKSKADLNGFLSALTEASKKYGIGIDGEPQLFLFETEDYWFDYAANKDDKLVRR